MEKRIGELISSGKKDLTYEEFEQICQEFESQFIDFKSLHEFREVAADNSKKSNLMNRVPAVISEYVSAFSNYSGGILIYGVRDNDRRIEDEGISDDLIGGSVLDWLSRVTASSTEPPVQSFCVQRIPDPNNSDKYFYQIVIGSSEHAPHQAKDMKYYGRFDDQNLPLRDQQVRDILNRRRNAKPKLEITIPALIAPPNNINMLISVNAITTNDIVIRNSRLIEVFHNEAVEIRTPYHEDQHRRVHKSGKTKLYQNQPFIYPDDESDFQKISIDLKDTGGRIIDFLEFRFVSTNSEVIRKTYRIRSNGIGYLELYDESYVPGEQSSYLWRPSSEGPMGQNLTHVDYIE